MAVNKRSTISRVLFGGGQPFISRDSRKNPSIATINNPVLDLLLGKINNDTESPTKQKQQQPRTQFRIDLSAVGGSGIDSLIPNNTIRNNVEINFREISESPIKKALQTLDTRTKFARDAIVIANKNFGKIDARVSRLVDQLELFRPPVDNSADEKNAAAGRAAHDRGTREWKAEANDPLKNFSDRVKGQNNATVSDGGASLTDKIIASAVGSFLSGATGAALLKVALKSSIVGLLGFASYKALEEFFAFQKHSTYKMMADVRKKKIEEKKQHEIQRNDGVVPPPNTVVGKDWFGLEIRNQKAKQMKGTKAPDDDYGLTDAEEHQYRVALRRRELEIKRFPTESGKAEAEARFKERTRHIKLKTTEPPTDSDDPPIPTRKPLKEAVGRAAASSKSADEYPGIEISKPKTAAERLRQRMEMHQDETDPKNYDWSKDTKTGRMNLGGKTLKQALTGQPHPPPLPAQWMTQQQPTKQSHIDWDSHKQTAAFLKHGKLPPGFEHVAGHQGILGKPVAAAAAGYAPFGGYPGMGGGSGTPGPQTPTNYMTPTHSGDGPAGQSTPPYKPAEISPGPGAPVGTPDPSPSVGITGGTQSQNLLEMKSKDERAAYMYKMAIDQGFEPEQAKVISAVAMHESANMSSSMFIRANNPIGMTIAPGQVRRGNSRSDMTGGKIVGGTVGADGQQHGKYATVEDSLKHLKTHSIFGPVFKQAKENKWNAEQIATELRNKGYNSADRGWLNKVMSYTNTVGSEGFNKHLEKFNSAASTAGGKDFTSSPELDEKIRSILGKANQNLAGSVNTGTKTYTQKQLEEANKARPRHIEGVVKFQGTPGFEGVQYKAATGGREQSMPYGVHKTTSVLKSGKTLTPYFKSMSYDQDLGQGKKGGARVINIGDAGGNMYDPKLKRMRTEIQGHPAIGGMTVGGVKKLISSGCLAVDPSKYKEFIGQYEKYYKANGGNVWLQLLPSAKGQPHEFVFTNKNPGSGNNITVNEAVSNYATSGDVQPETADVRAAAMGTKSVEEMQEYIAENTYRGEDAKKKLQINEYGFSSADDKKQIMDIIPESVKSLRVKASNGKTTTLGELGVERYSELSEKGQQAFAGGRFGRYNDPNVTFMAGEIQKSLGGSFNRVTAQNDKFHHGSYAKQYMSPHLKGTKLDFTITGDYSTEVNKLTAVMKKQYNMVEGKHYKIVRNFNHGTGKHVDIGFTPAGRSIVEAYRTELKAKQYGSGLPADPTQMVLKDEEALHDAATRQSHGSYLKTQGLHGPMASKMALDKIRAGATKPLTTPHDSMIKKMTSGGEMTGKEAWASLPDNIRPNASGMEGLVDQGPSPKPQKDLTPSVGVQTTPNRITLDDPNKLSASNKAKYDAWVGTREKADITASMDVENEAQTKETYKEVKQDVAAKEAATASSGSSGGSGGGSGDLSNYPEREMPRPGSSGNGNSGRCWV